MALVLADRVKETTSTTGTGTITLAGAVTGFQSFSIIGNSNTTYYAIVDNSTGAWEVGIGTYTSSGTTLARTTVLSSSNSDNLVNFAAGSKDVFVTYPSEKSVFLNASDVVAQQSFGAITATSAALTTGTITTAPSGNTDIANKLYVDGAYSAGTGLSLSTRTFSITPVGTASTYGSASQVPVITTNASGQVSSVTNTSIAISGSAVSGNISGSAGSVANALTLGSFLTGTSYDGSLAVTAAVDATSTNTASKVVVRDASGNFSAGTITAALSGNATSATSATSATTATTATNLASGSAGTIPYQSAAGTTAMLAVGTSGQVLTSNGAAAPTWAAAGGGANLQEFSSSGTWTKPSGATFVLVEAFGGGGGGGSGRLPPTNDPAGGGAGGGGSGYNYKLFKASDLASTVTITIGAGGAGGAAKATEGNGNNGSNGGNSTFGSHLTAYGGGLGVGGKYVTNGNVNGGAGGGTTGAASGTTAGAPLITATYSGGGTITVSNQAFGGGPTGGASGFGGGGGGTAKSFSSGSNQPGGCSAYGSGGGGAGFGDIAGGTSAAQVGGSNVGNTGGGGAVSTAGGTNQGGGGGAQATAGGAGGARGGGGGGGGSGITDTSPSGAGGAGGNGYIAVYTW
jgi:hypothetical protein